MNPLAFLFSVPCQKLETKYSKLKVTFTAFYFVLLDFRRVFFSIALFLTPSQDVDIISLA